jgi:hypothetical protein
MKLAHFYEPKSLDLPRPRLAPVAMRSGSISSRLLRQTLGPARDPLATPISNFRARRGRAKFYAPFTRVAAEKNALRNSDRVM